MASPERVFDSKSAHRRRLRSLSETGRHAKSLRRVVQGGLASALAVVGLVAFATPSFAHDNFISATASCASPAGSGYTIDWTIENDFNASETGSVTSVTGGLSTLGSSTFSIAASPGQPYSSTTVTQTLPPSTSGLITIDISTTWSDSFSTTDVGAYNLSQLHCAAPSQTIAGHIYLCNDANPTTTEQSGGTLGASGATPVPATSNPLAPTEVGAGTYTMTATPPPGYQLVACGGSSTPNASGSTATESVSVPSGGAGVGIFYVTPVTQTIAGHIYLCNDANPTTTEQSGGTLGASGATPVPATSNPLAPTEVGAGTYTMTATPPPGYQLVACGGSSTPNASGSTATESVSVPSGGAGVGIFYVVANPVTNPTATPTGSGGASGSGGSSPTTPAPTSTLSTTLPPATSTTPPAATSTLAFTGAPLAWEWLFGVALVLLGSMLLALPRWRREFSGAGWLRHARLPRARAGLATAALDYPAEPPKTSPAAHYGLRDTSTRRPEAISLLGVIRWRRYGIFGTAQRGSDGADSRPKDGSG